ncbi:hypothetical protein HUJ04_008558 [Dendroctonus ponderosae]|nr:hypothetical protein HUJ04_008558 [Dendroctonus ponderosae]
MYKMSICTSHRPRADQHEYTKEHDYCAANQLLAKEATVPVEVSDDEQFDQITDVTNLRELIEAMSVPSLTKSPTPILAGGLLSHAEDENFNETGFRGFDNGHLSCGDAQAAGSPELPTLDGPYETKVPPRQPIKEFVCHSCSKTYQSFGALQRHLKFECNINQKFKCPLPECKYKSAVVSSVIKHVSAMHPQYDVAEIHRSSLYRSADSETAQRAGRPSLFMRQNLLREKEPGSNSCRICGKSYKVARSLWRHYKYECQQEPRFCCQHCSYKAKHKASVIKHMWAVHSNLPPVRYQCPFCSKSYTLIKNLRRHMSVECQKEKRFKCHLCANSYYYRTDLRNHMHRVHDIIAGHKFVCMKCGKSYKRKIHLNSHVRYECGVEPQFKCSLCSKACHQKSNLRTHVKVVHHISQLDRQWMMANETRFKVQVEVLLAVFSGNKFRCIKCGKSYKRKTNLNSHLRYECGVEPQFKCNQCGKAFHQKSNFRTHVKAVHPISRFDQKAAIRMPSESDYKFVCLKCGKGYKQKFILNRHVRYECGVKPQFKCHLCGHKFVCIKCDKKYKRKIHLNRHVRYECGVEPQFKCSLCGNKFVCIKCDKRYKRKIHLNSHVRYECGVAPQFQCNLCGRAFHQKSNLRQHIKVVHHTS